MAFALNVVADCWVQKQTRTKSERDHWHWVRLTSMEQATSVDAVDDDGDIAAVADDSAAYDGAV